MTASPEPGPGSDEVDQVIAAWHRERPDLDLEPLAVLSRVYRLARLLDITRREAFRAHGPVRGQHGNIPL